jgi:hypothetical protein
MFAATSKHLFPITALVLGALACGGPADPNEANGNETDEGSSSAAVSIGPDCSNIFTLIATNPSHMLLNEMFITYDSTNYAVVADGFLSEPNAFTVSGSSNDVVVKGAGVADRASLVLGGRYSRGLLSYLYPNNHIGFELYDSATGSILTTIDITATECTVNNTNGTITGVAGDDSRLTVKIFGLPISG